MSKRTAEDVIVSNAVALQSIVLARANGASWGLVLDLVKASQNDLESWLEENDLQTEPL